jgi:hypothetical protein
VQPAATMATFRPMIFNLSWVIASHLRCRGAALRQCIFRVGPPPGYHRRRNAHTGGLPRPRYDRQRPPLFAEALRAAKKALDAQGLLNPGILIDP